MSDNDPKLFDQLLADVALKDTRAVLTLDSVNAEYPASPSGEGKTAFKAVETTQLGNVAQENAASQKVGSIFDQALAGAISQQENSPATPSPEHDPGKDI